MRNLARFAAIALTAATIAPAAANAEHRLGIGYHYFETLDDVDIDDIEGIEDAGNSVVVSYQWVPGGLLRFEADLEYYADGYGGSTEEAFAPQVYVLVGSGFYGGVGIGMTNSDGFVSGDDWSDPWYAARVGLDLLLLPKLRLDINANYRADAFAELDQADTDAITLGASLRFAF